MVVKLTFSNLSIIVPFKPDGKERDLNWEWIKLRYKKLIPDAEICIGEYDLDPYKKSIAINSAVKKSTRDVLLIIDADIILSIESIEKSLELIEKHGVVFPYNRLVKFSKSITDTIISQDNFNIDDSFIGSACSVYPNPSSSICFIKKDIFKKTGGVDERFTGWGYEDSSFFRVINLVNNGFYRIVPNTMYHLYHEYGANYKNKELILNNSKIFENYYNKETIANTIKELREINKFL